MDSSIFDFAMIMIIIEDVMNYPFPVFGFYITLDDVVIASEVLAMALDALREVFE